MSDTPKAYDPSQVENRWYRAWEEAGLFHGRPNPEREPYCIMIPPPNVTGTLTMGHVLNNTIQDILVRRARLDGREAMWLPGTDHAGIATQTRVERVLRDEEGITRHDLGREAFLERVRAWREKHGGIILDQLRKLGASCDWERTVFTLDPEYERAVLHAFVELYRRGYIYRGKRMVHWCPVSRTALSDEEVIMKPQRGRLYTMRYEVVERPGTYVEIATTRPETLMGDTAVAFHPEDERYRHLKGKHAWRPFPREEIPFICDDAVDREFGTGMLKVTPAHDRADYEIGQRHGLAVIDIFNPDGTLNERAGEDFAGMDRVAARKHAVARLRESDQLVREESYEHSVGYSERADVPIEPRLTEQWWMRYPKVEEAKSAVREKMIRFWPPRWEKTYLHWLDNIQDWCISRQLWWGQRIPVWYRKGLDCERLNYSDPAQVHVSVDGPEDPENWEREEDVLDTWASSWLWPFATLGWPDPDAEQAGDLQYFYPTSALVTGPDIIFFWVARMIMAGLEFMGEPYDRLEASEIRRRIPFRDVYFTGIIRDAQGRKMSKSLGNSPDPLDLIERFGADGLRFGIMSIAPKGQDILFSEERISQGRHFCNKLWNACRFRQMSGPVGELGSLASIRRRIDWSQCDDFDHWILERLHATIAAVEKAYAGFEFTQLTQGIYGFFWNDFCDWYVEVSKSKLQREGQRETCLAIQDLVLREVLLLLHPICPFITEELWSVLGYCGEGRFLQETAMDRSGDLFADQEPDDAAVHRVVGLLELVTQARALKAQYNLAAQRDVVLFCQCEPAARRLIETQRDNLLRLVGASRLEFVANAPDKCPAAVVSVGTVYLDLASSLDLEAEQQRLSKELARLEGVIAGAEKKLSNENFTGRAPEEVVAGVRETLDRNRERRDELRKLLDALGGPA